MGKEKVKTITPGAPMSDAAQMMVHHDVSCLGAGRQGGRDCLMVGMQLACSTRWVALCQNITACVVLLDTTLLLPSMSVSQPVTHNT